MLAAIVLMLVAVRIDVIDVWVFDRSDVSDVSIDVSNIALMWNAIETAPSLFSHQWYITDINANITDITSVKDSHQ